MWTLTQTCCFPWRNFGYTPHLSYPVKKNILSNFYSCQFFTKKLSFLRYLPLLLHRLVLKKWIVRRMSPSTQIRSAPGGKINIITLFYFQITQANFLEPSIDKPRINHHLVCFDLLSCVECLRFSMLSF